MTSSTALKLVAPVPKPAPEPLPYDAVKLRSRVQLRVRRQKMTGNVIGIIHAAPKKYDVHSASGEVVRDVRHADMLRVMTEPSGPVLRLDASQDARARVEERGHRMASLGLKKPFGGFCAGRHPITETLGPEPEIEPLRYD